MHTVLPSRLECHRLHPRCMTLQTMGRGKVEAGKVEGGKMEVGKVEGGKVGGLLGGFPPEPEMVISAQFWNCSPSIADPSSPLPPAAIHTHWRVHLPHVTPAGSRNLYVAFTGVWCMGTV